MKKSFIGINSPLFIVIITALLLSMCAENTAHKSELRAYLIQTTWKTDSVAIKKGSAIIANNISGQSFVLKSDSGYFVDSVIVMINDTIIPITYNKDHSIFNIPYDFEKIDTTKHNSIKVTFSKFKK